MADIPALDILLHGAPVGRILHLRGGRTLFEFDEAYLGDKDRPVLGLSFGDGEGGIETGTLPEPGRLPPFFSNLLPEWVRPDRLAGWSGDDESDIWLLGALGNDLPGAVAARMEPGGGRRAGTMEFKFAGIRLKFSATADSQERLTVRLDGRGGDWLVKPPSPQWPGLAENEYAMMELARLAGLAVPEARLVPLTSIDGLPGGIGGWDGMAVAVRRFDRVDGTPVHAEDFAQVFAIHPERKYNRGSLANIAQVLSRAAGPDDALEFVRRIVLNALIGNGDASLKDWALVYPDRRTPSLAPPGGLVSTVAYLPAGFMSLKVSRSRDYADFGKDELLHLAERAALPRKAVWDTARETVQLFNEAWGRESGNLPIGGDAVSAITGHLETLPLAREA